LRPNQAGKLIEEIAAVLEPTEDVGKSAELYSQRCCRLTCCNCARAGLQNKER
jgi:hypothetical protein